MLYKTTHTGKLDLATENAHLVSDVMLLDLPRERVYDPTVGKWLSEDPIGFLGGQTNLSEYVGNDPMDNTDPSGTSALDVIKNVYKFIDPVPIDPTLIALEVATNDKQGLADAHNNYQAANQLLGIPVDGVEMALRVAASDNRSQTAGQIAANAGQALQDVAVGGHPVVQLWQAVRAGTAEKANPNIPGDTDKPRLPDLNPDWSFRLFDKNETCPAHAADRMYIGVVINMGAFQALTFVPASTTVEQQNQMIKNLLQARINAGKAGTPNATFAQVMGEGKQTPVTESIPEPNPKGGFLPALKENHAEMLATKAMSYTEAKNMFNSIWNTLRVAKAPWTIVVDQVPCEENCFPTLERNLPPGSNVFVPEQVAAPGGSPKTAVKAALNSGAALQPRQVLTVPPQPKPPMIPLMGPTTQPQH